jgi:acid phosphatase type 7
MIQARLPRSFVLSVSLALLIFSGCGTTGPEVTPVPVPVAVTYPQIDDPIGVFLTWQRDPLTTMTIDWHAAEPVPWPALEWRITGTTAWQASPAGGVPFPGSERRIYRSEIRGLHPDTSYDFRPAGASRVFRFRTMPEDLSRPVLIAAGGDTRHSQEMMERTARQVATHDVDFIMIGGDLAYADGNLENVERWHEWFDAYMNTLVREDGRVIPMVVGMGNHETRRSFVHNDEDFTETNAWRESVAPFFYSFFAFPGHPGYGALHFGDYLSVLSLDSDHTNRIDGPQLEWLEEVLFERSTTRHIFPFYHVPAYPSVRRFDGSVSARVRDHWVPLFERAGVRLAFENHDHAYKRTFPIREGAVHEDGIVYVGDGAWGVGVREIGREHDEPAWYLEEAASARHFILVRLYGDELSFETIDEDGNVIDRWSSP